MRVSCPSCHTNYNIDDKRIPAGGAKLKCTKCQTTFPVKPGQAAAAGLPAAPTNGFGAVPLPGSGRPSAPAPVVSSPLTVPLPGLGMPGLGEAVPLPGFDATSPGTAPGTSPIAPPAPFAERPTDWEHESTRVADIQVPSAAFRDPNADPDQTVVRMNSPGAAVAGAVP